MGKNPPNGESPPRAPGRRGGGARAPRPARTDAHVPALATLAAGLAHEINNPLACIIANLDLVARELAALRRERGERLASRAARLGACEEALQDAREGAERIRAIARALRTFSELQAPPPAPLDVMGALAAALELTRAAPAPRRESRARPSPARGS